MLAVSMITMLKYNHDSIISMDRRTISALTPEEDGVVNLTSTVIMRNSMLSTTWLFYSLSIGIGSYLSLNYTKCRQEAAMFRRWARFNQFPILIGFLFFLIGSICHVVAIRLLMEALFPKYCVLHETIESSDPERMHTAPEIIYNASAGSLLELDGTQVEEVGREQSCPLGACRFMKYSFIFRGHHCYEINQNIASYYKVMASVLPCNPFPSRSPPALCPRMS